MNNRVTISQYTGPPEPVPVKGSGGTEVWYTNDMYPGVTNHGCPSRHGNSERPIIRSPVLEPDHKSIVTFSTSSRSNGIKQAFSFSQSQPPDSRTSAQERANLAASEAPG